MASDFEQGLLSYGQVAQLQCRPDGVADAALEKTFVQRAEQAGFNGLKGHASVGGMRASLYNAVTLEAVEALTAFMKGFVRVDG